MAARSDRTTSEEVRSALLLARRGQAFWARALSEVSDGGLRDPSGLEGRTRAHIVAEVAAQARTLARLVEAVAGVADVDDPYVPAGDVAFASTLPADALRHYAAHSAVHLNVTWRDLDDDQWTASLVRDGVPHLDARAAGLRTVRDTIDARTRLVWQRAVDLGVGYGRHDLPAPVLTLLAVGEGVGPSPTARGPVTHPLEENT